MGYYIVLCAISGLIGVLIALARRIEPWIGLVLGAMFPLVGWVVVLFLRRDGQAIAPPPHPASQWLADPTGRHQYRLWDGVQWSAHVSDNGRSGLDPLH